MQLKEFINKVLLDTNAEVVGFDIGVVCEGRYGTSVVFVEDGSDDRISFEVKRSQFCRPKICMEKEDKTP